MNRNSNYPIPPQHPFSTNLSTFTHWSVQDQEPSLRVSLRSRSATKPTIFPAAEAAARAMLKPQLIAGQGWKDWKEIGRRLERLHRERERHIYIYDHIIDYMMHHVKAVSMMCCKIHLGFGFS